MTWIKICGTTNLEDALTAVDAGADALGFVFYEKSPRNVDPETVREIVAKLPDTIEKVGVFVNRTADEVRATAMKAGMTAVQVYLDVDPAQGNADCAHCFEQIAAAQPELKLMPVLAMHESRPESPAMLWDPDAIHAFLLDSSRGGQPGGTGQPFDWEANVAAVKVIKTLGKVVIAGGLNPSNVTEAIRILNPWGVDVVSGVEASPGKKDPEKVRAFITAVREFEERTQ